MGAVAVTLEFGGREACVAIAWALPRRSVGGGQIPVIRNFVRTWLLLVRIRATGCASGADSGEAALVGGVPIRSSSAALSRALPRSVCSPTASPEALIIVEFRVWFARSPAKVLAIISRNSCCRLGTGDSQPSWSSSREAWERPWGTPKASADVLSVRPLLGSARFVNVPAFAFSQAQRLAPIGMSSLSCLSSPPLPLARPLARTAVLVSRSACSLPSHRHSRGVCLGASLSLLFLGRAPPLRLLSFLILLHPKMQACCGARTCSPVSRLHSSVACVSMCRRESHERDGWGLDLELVGVRWTVNEW